MMRMQADEQLEPQKEYAGTGIIGWLVAGLILATAAVIFIAQNVDRVEVEWLWLDFRVSLAVIALGGVLLGVLGAVAIGVVVRRRRRQELQNAQELAALRSRAAPEPQPGLDDERPEGEAHGQM